MQLFENAAYLVGIVGCVQLGVATLSDAGVEMAYDLIRDESVDASFPAHGYIIVAEVVDSQVGSDAELLEGLFEVLKASGLACYVGIRHADETFEDIGQLVRDGDVTLGGCRLSRNEGLAVLVQTVTDLDDAALQIDV